MISISLRHNHLGDTSVVCGFDVSVDMPALTGSPKQIAYADAIRAASIKDFVDARAIRQARLADGSWIKNATFNSPELVDLVAKLNAGCAQLAAKLAEKTEAKTWIDAANGSKSLSTVNALIARTN